MLLKPEKFESGGSLFSRAWMKNIVKTELFENDDDKTT